jgi:hypothetical protein
LSWQKSATASVTCDDFTPIPVNLALQAHATSSPPASYFVQPELANDGNPNSQWTLTSQYGAASWRVNLGKKYMVYRLKATSLYDGRGLGKDNIDFNFYRDGGYVFGQDPTFQAGGSGDASCSGTCTYDVPPFSVGGYIRGAGIEADAVEVYFSYIYTHYPTIYEFEVYGAGSGCNSSTYKLKIYSSNPGSCPSDYAQYDKTSPQIISSYSWVCAAAKDKRGYLGTSIPAEFKIDVTPPSVSINSPGPGDLQNSNFTVGYSATDNVAISTCKLYIRNGDSSKSFVYKRDIACGNNQEINITLLSDCTVEGTNMCGVRIWANDSVNQASQIERNFSTSFALSALIISPDAGSRFNSAFIVNYTANSPTISTCRLNISNNGIWQDKGKINCGNNLQIPISVGPGKNCSAEGVNACTIKIWANSSINSINQTERSFTVDYTPPLTSIISPSPGIWQNSNFTVNYSATDNLALSTCKLFIRNGTNAWTDEGNINCLANQINITVGKGKNCTVEGLNTCGVRIWINDTFNQANYIERNFSIDYSAPSIEIKALNYDYSFVTRNITFNISCYDATTGCSSLNYSYLNFNYSDKKYNTLNKFIFAKQIFGNNTLDNVTCTDGNVCRTYVRVYASDNLGNVNITDSQEFKIDLQKPIIEKEVDCTYKKTGSTSSTQCSKGTITPGSIVTLVVFANDTTGNFIGSGVKNIAIYLKDPEGKASQPSMNLLGTIRKNSTSSINAAKIGEYVYTATVEDEVGFRGTNYSNSFFVGGDPGAKCNASGNILCNFYQVCSGIVVPSKDTSENLGIYCCFGKCLNRSTLSTCKQQGGEIYDKNLSNCPGTDVPASDTTEKNRCCKGELTTKTASSLAWYDMAGNKISGAARGDKAKCMGLSNSDSPDAHFDIKITLGTITLFDKQNIKVSSTTKANSSIITLNETGTYRCEATFIASPMSPVNLKVIEAPTKPRYTELPGFSSIAMLIAIVGLMIYYLARRK